MQIATKRTSEQVRIVDEIFSSVCEASSRASAFGDDGVVPFGHGQFGGIVVADVEDFEAFQFGRSAAQFGRFGLVSVVHEALQQGVIVGQVMRVLALAFAHVQVSHARLHDPGEGVQVAESDFERLAAALLLLLGAIAALIGALLVVHLENVFELSRTFGARQSVLQQIHAQPAAQVMAG